MSEDGGDHAERMDAVYRGQRHIYDLTRKYYLLGRDRLIARLNPPPSGTILEIGCGTGRNLVAVAERYPDARLFGLDISSEMLTSARKAVEKAGLTDRVILAQGDASDFRCRGLFGRDTVDRAYFSYTLSMVPDWRTAIGCGIDAVSAEGQLHIVDFGQQERLPRLFAKGLEAWLAKFHVSTREELFEAARRLAEQRGREAACTPLYRGYAWSVEIG